MPRAKAAKVKVALVTGASRGIGRAIALRLAGDGVHVVVHYRRSRRAAVATVREIEKKGGQAFSVEADLSTLKGVRALFRAMDKRLRSLLGTPEFDILVNNAGMSHTATIEETTEGMFDEVMAVNAKAPFFIIRQAVARLRDGGRIINISSGTSRMAFPEKAAYAMSKAALNSLTLSLVEELGPRGITVNAVAPGIVDTEFHGGWLRSPAARKHAASIAALGRVGLPDDIADVAAFLASSDSRW